MFEKMGQKMQNMPFLADLGHLTPKWHFCGHITRNPEGGPFVKNLWKKRILISKVSNNQKNFTDSNGVGHLGQMFGKMGQKMQNMPFLAELGHFTPKWHILHFLTHFLKHLAQMSYTVGISEVFLIV